VVPRAQVGNWLYGVAYNTALKALAMTSKRRAKERQAGKLPKSHAPEENWQQLEVLLDQELSRLPDRYRVPVVLWGLEAKPVKEAGRQRGWPQGTVASRLGGGRVLLAKRLARHGLTFSCGGLAALVSQGTASAEVPIPLTVSTVKAAALFARCQAVTTGVIPARVTALTEGVLKAMFLTKLKIIAAVLLLVAVVGLGVSGLVTPTQAQEGGVREDAKQLAGRPKWEYKALSRPGVEKLAAKDSKDKLTDGLNLLASEGWELVAVEPAAPGVLGS